MTFLLKIKNLFRKIPFSSDGYHTFEELYEHRTALFIALAKGRSDSWWSHCHSDGNLCFDGSWVIVGIGTNPGRQITYHIRADRFLAYYGDRKINQIPKAPSYDEHSSADVLLRLKKDCFGDKDDN